MLRMSYQEYNKMIDFAKQFVAKPGGPRPILEFIKLTFSRNSAIAEALDGYKAGQIQLTIDSEVEGELLLPLTNKLKKTDVFAIISELDNEIEIKTATGKIAFEKPFDKFYDTSTIYPKDEPIEVIGFDPLLLSDALRAFKDENTVEIEYRGVFKPIVIKSNTAQAIMMPKRLSR